MGRGPAKKTVGGKEFTRDPHSRYYTKKGDIKTSADLPSFTAKDKISSIERERSSTMIMARKRYDNNKGQEYKNYLRGGDWPNRATRAFLVEDVATDLLLAGPSILFTIVLAFQKPSNWGRFWNVDAHSAVQLRNQRNTCGLQIGLQSAGELVVENWRKRNPKTNKLFFSFSKPITHKTAERVFVEILKDIKKEYIYKRVADPLSGTINCTTWAIKICKVAGFNFNVYNGLLWNLKNNPNDLYLRLKKENDLDFRKYALNYKPPLPTSPHPPKPILTKPTRHAESNASKFQRIQQQFQTGSIWRKNP